MDTVIIDSDSSGISDSALLDSSSSVSVTQTENTDSTVIASDQLEGNLYRTQVSETKISITFQSRVFYDMFQNKMHADFRQSVEKDDTTFISKCSTHVRGAKCDLKLDRHFKTVELSGLGFKKWREERFPKVAQYLFGRLMKNIDSQLDGSSSGSLLPEELSETCFQQEPSFTENIESTPSPEESRDQSPPPNAQLESKEKPVTPSEPVHSVKSSVLAPTCTDGNYTISGIQKEFIAEKLIYGASSSANINSNNDHENFKEVHQQGAVSGNNENLLTYVPMFTSIPIVQRQDGILAENSGLTSVKVCALLNKIDQLDSGIKSLKSEIIQKMELRLNELKVSLINMIESVGRNASYADSVKQSYNHEQQQHVPVRERRLSSESCATDEGYGNLSDGSFQADSSQTHVKQIYTPVPDTEVLHISSDINRQQSSDGSGSPHHVPVRITNRTSPRDRQQTPTTSNLKLNRTLIVSDSLLKEASTKGMKKGVTICAKSGASIKDIWSELSVYNLNTFDNVIICVGGNDASNRTDTSRFEDDYDELLSYIRSTTRDCIVHLCKVVPRGDVDVSCINTSIQHVADHWKTHKINFIEETYDLFFGQNGLPASRYYDGDGIHLPNSGIRRLLDALNRHVQIVEDFQKCVARYRQQQNKNGGPGQYRQLHQGNIPNTGNRQPNVSYTGNENTHRSYTGNRQSHVTYTGNGNTHRSYSGNGQPNVPYTGNGQPNVPYMGNGQLNVPRTGNGQSNIPYTGNGQPNIPYTGNGQPNIPYAGNGQPNIPYTGNRQSNRSNIGNGHFQRQTLGASTNKKRQVNRKWGGKKLCFCCSMPGHLIADCWFAK